MTRIKICGLTREQDVRMAVEAGADAVGFVHVPGSRRYVDPEQLLTLSRSVPPLVHRVAVIADLPLEEAALLAEGLDALQLHGSEDASYLRSLRERLTPNVALLKAIRVDSALDPQAIAELEQHVQALLLDSGGGTGSPFDWSLVEGFRSTVPLILAGGLTPLNVAEAVLRLRPFAVDVASGVEAEPGRKDPDRLRAFVRGVRGADSLALGERRV